MIKLFPIASSLAMLLACTQVQAFGPAKPVAAPAPVPAQAPSPASASVPTPAPAPAPVAKPAAKLSVVQPEPAAQAKDKDLKEAKPAVKPQQKTPVAMNSNLYLKQATSALNALASELRGVQ